jgi:creatinine amidohydrolase
MERKKYLYEHYTWQELGEIVKKQPVAVLPIGSVEDHGLHLPLDTDNFIIWSICSEAARRADGEVLLLPLIPYGFETHHMDFPGTIDIRMEHLLNFVLDITKSIAHHGFKHILIADGHGSNMPILDLVARRTILETESLCAAFIWPSLAIGEIRAVRESERGGMSHACELETSVYLHLNGQRVQMDKAAKEMGMARSEFIWSDLVEGPPVRLMDHWTRFSKSGVNGDPTLATAEKGRIIFEAVVEAFLRLVREFKNRPRGERIDHHKMSQQAQAPEPGHK